MQNNEKRVGKLRGAACAAMFVFGIAMALLGAVLPSLAQRLAFETADIGRLFLAMNGAMLAASLLLGLAMDRFGMKPPLALGPLLVDGGVAIVASAESFSSLLRAIVLLGVGGGALNGAATTLMSDLHDDPGSKGAALNRLGIFFGFGAVLLPFAMGRLAIGPALTGAAVLCAAVGGFAVLLRFPAPKQGHALRVAEMPRFLHSPVVIALAALLFFESGVERTLGGFISTYLVRDMAVSSVAVASWALAAFWAATMIARAVLSRIATGWSHYATVGGCAALACLGATIIAAAPGAVVATAGIVLCGAALAAIFPTVLAIAGARFQSHSGTVFGILFAVAISGGMTLPWAASHIGAASGLRWVFVMVAASFAAIVGLSRVVRAQSLRARAASQP
jgi:MFS transporter, FHS family, glucose/mannose:H+ symporter